MKPAKTRMTTTIYAIIALVAVLCLWILFRAKPIAANVVTVKKGHFLESLVVPGTVRSQSKFTVTAFATGDLNQVDLKVGDPVRKNQQLAILRWDVSRAVSSPADGVVSKVYREAAGPINRGEPIVEIIDPEKLEVVVEVLTTDAVRLSEGTMATIGEMGLGMTLSAQIRRISRAGFVKLSALGIEEEKTNVYLRFLTPPPSSVGDNFHVEVRFEISKDENVISIPIGALLRNKETWSVYKVERNRAQIQNVSVEKKSDTSAVISQGLKEGDLIIVFPSDQVSDGKKIKPIPF